MLDKITRVKLIEHWFSIDNILLGGDPKKVIKSPKLFEQYITLKGAFLSTLSEYYDHINYIAKYDGDIPKSTEELKESAKLNSEYSKKISASILNKKQIKESIKNRIIKESEKKNVDVSKMDAFTESVVRNSFLKLTLDNILIGIPRIESACKKCTKDFRSSILSESYKMYRDALVKIALLCTKK